MAISVLDANGTSRSITTLAQPDGSQTNGVFQVSGVGSLQAVPTTGTPSAPVALGAQPSNVTGLRFYLAAADSVTFAVAASNPGANPVTFTISGASSGTGPNWDENLFGQQFWITATSGAPKFRWY
jgi:hypothetical protein